MYYNRLSEILEKHLKLEGGFEPKENQIDWEFKAQNCDR